MVSGHDGTPGLDGARRFTAGTEGRAAKLGSYGGLQRAREVACKVPDAWQSMWVDDSTAEAHARVRSAGKRARRGEQGLAAPVARDLRLLRLHRRKAHREALCGQAGGPLSREMTRGRSMPGQRVVVRFIVPEQIERVWDSVGVGSSVATHRTPRKVRWGAGKAQTRPAGAVGVGCRGISDLVIWRRSIFFVEMHYYSTTANQVKPLSVPASSSPELYATAAVQV